MLAGFGVIGSLYMLIEVRYSASPGKRALRLEIAADDGAPAPVGVRLSRYLVKNCHLLVAAIAGVSGMWMAGVLAPVTTLVVVAGAALMFTGERRALHDMVAGTAVFSRGSVP